MPRHPVRAKIAELNLRITAKDREIAALEAARSLDSDEVGQRADRRKTERSATTDSDTDTTRKSGQEP